MRVRELKKMTIEQMQGDETDKCRWLPVRIVAQKTGTTIQTIRNRVARSDLEGCNHYGRLYVKLCKD